MSIAAVSSNSIYQQLQGFYLQRKSDLQQLGQALQSGDLAGAQQAFNALQTLGQSGPFASAEPFRKTQREQDFAAVGQALQSGDLAGAQQAFATLESTFHHPSAPANTSSANGPAVVVNLGVVDPGAAPSGGPTNSSSPAASSSSSGSGTAGPEVVINLGANPGVAEKLTIDVNNTGNNSEQISISLSTASLSAASAGTASSGATQNPASQDQITLNLNANGNEQIILNLLNSSTSNPSPSGLSVVA